MGCLQTKCPHRKMWSMQPGSLTAGCSMAAQGLVGGASKGVAAGSKGGAAAGFCGFCGWLWLAVAAVAAVAACVWLHTVPSVLAHLSVGAALLSAAAFPKQNCEASP